MRAFVDKDLCIGCGMCVSTCEAVFRLDAEGKAETYTDTTDDNKNDVKAAIEGCPVSAIRESE